jgi:hypothetical protein
MIADPCGDGLAAKVAVMRLSIVARITTLTTAINLLNLVVLDIF